MTGFFIHKLWTKSRFWNVFSFTNCERNPDFGIVELWVLHYARICFVGLAENRACKAAPCERWQRGDVAALHRGPSIPRGWVLRSSSLWAAKKRFEISKFKFKFLRARTYELIRARSRLYRSQILQVNTRWKALAEIYTMHSFAPFSWDPSGWRNIRKWTPFSWDPSGWISKLKFLFENR